MEMPLLEKVVETKEEIGDTTRCEHYDIGVQIEWLWIWTWKKLFIQKIEIVMNVSNEMSCYMLRVL